MGLERIWREERSEGKEMEIKKEYKEGRKEGRKERRKERMKEEKERKGKERKLRKFGHTIWSMITSNTLGTELRIDPIIRRILSNCAMAMKGRNARVS